MNKVEVGFAPSPNLKQVRSKIGSLDNASHKPGGGQVKIESRKIDIKAAPRIEAKNTSYVSKGGDKKVIIRFILNVTLLLQHNNNLAIISKDIIKKTQKFMTFPHTLWFSFHIDCIHLYT